MAAPSRLKVSYDYPRPALTVDVVLATREEIPRVLLVKRKHSPYRGKWALLGGFVNEGERLYDPALRELHEETNVTVEDLEQLYAAGDPGRDPRGWTVSIVFLGRVPAGGLQATAGDDAAAANWFPLDELPPLAFDHARIVERAAARMKDRTH